MLETQETDRRVFWWVLMVISAGAAAVAWRLL